MISEAGDNGILSWRRCRYNFLPSRCCHFRTSTGLGFGIRLRRCCAIYDEYSPPPSVKVRLWGLQQLAPRPFLLRSFMRPDRFKLGSLPTAGIFAPWSASSPGFFFFCLTWRSAKDFLCAAIPQLARSIFFSPPLTLRAT